MKVNYLPWWEKAKNTITDWYRAEKSNAREDKTHIQIYLHDDRGYSHHIGDCVMRGHYNVGPDQYVPKQHICEDALRSFCHLYRKDYDYAIKHVKVVSHNMPMPWENSYGQYAVAGKFHKHIGQIQKIDCEIDDPFWHLLESQL